MTLICFSLSDANDTKVIKAQDSLNATPKKKEDDHVRVRESFYSCQEKLLVNTARASGTNNVSTARHNFNRQAVSSNAARKVHTVKPIVNNAKVNTVKPMVSAFRKTFNRTTTLRTNFSKQNVNTAEVNAVSAVGGKRETAHSLQIQWWIKT
ncbi:hypothetical protein Tco_0671197 [Tanacetum coccineum]